MSTLHYSTSMSLDGFVAGRNQSTEHPLGVGGELLHQWMRVLAAWRKEALGLDDGEVNASTAVLEERDRTVGAVIMGRNMFGGGPGPWGDGAWRGWWGENPPFHLPVFVLTHHPRRRLDMEGGTSFTFVTDGIEAALDAARSVAGSGDIDIAGGAGIAKQYFAAGLIDEFQIHHVPVFLGDGIRLFDDPALLAANVERVGVIEAPRVTHITYRIVRDAQCASQP